MPDAPPLRITHVGGSQCRAEIEEAFAAAGLSDRLIWLPPGKPTGIDA